MAPSRRSGQRVGGVLAGPHVDPRSLEGGASLEGACTLIAARDDSAVEEASASVAAPVRNNQSSASTSAAAPGDPSEEFGANEWLVEEMYERFQADPGSVDDAWVDFFRTRGTSEGANGAAAGDGAGDATGDGARAGKSGRA